MEEAEGIRKRNKEAEAMTEKRHPRIEITRKKKRDKRKLNRFREERIDSASGASHRVVTLYSRDGRG